MATIKSYSDLQQSKKLAEILPIESADMVLPFRHSKNDEYIPGYVVSRNYVEVYNEMMKLPAMEKEDVCQLIQPAWSLATLLSILPKEIEIDGQHYAPCLFPVKSKWLLKLWYNSNHTFTSPIAIFSDNPVDACVDMIEKLHELKMLR